MDAVATSIEISGSGRTGTSGQQRSMAIAPDFDELVRVHRLDSFERLFDRSLGQLLNKPGLAGWRQRVRLKLAESGGERVLFVKRFVDPPRSMSRQVRRSGTMARSIAGVEWHRLMQLQQAGVLCPEPVALAEELSRGREIRSAVVMTAVPGDALERWMPQWGQFDAERRREIARCVAGIVAHFHAEGFVHRDLYLSHLFYDPTLPTGEAIHLIDVQRVVRPRVRRQRWIVKDLAAMNFSTPTSCFSRSQRLRWLLDYLCKAKLDAEAKRLAYRVIGKTLSIGRRSPARRQQGS